MNRRYKRPYFSGYKGGRVKICVSKKLAKKYKSKDLARKKLKEVVGYDRNKYQIITKNL